METATLPDKNDPSGKKQNKDKPPRDPEGRMTFTAHLGELRMRLIRSTIAVLVGFVICYGVSNTLIEWLSYPLRPLQPNISDLITPDVEPEPELAVGQEATTQTFGVIRWTVLHPLEPFLVKIKIAAYGGLFLAFPYVLYHVCAFIFPGLTATEKRIVRFLLVGCMSLGLAGASLAYWGIFPLVLPYLVQFAPSFVDVQLRLNETLSLILKGLAAFGIAFQLPMIVLILVYIGVLSPAVLKAYRKFATIGIFVAAAMFTPPDPISLILLAGPLVLLYEFSIWASYIVMRRKMKKAAK